MNRFTSALATICDERLLAEKWLIGPSLRTAHQWLDSVTRSGQAVVNVHCKTVKGLALNLAAPRIARSGLHLVSARGATIMIDRILSGLKRRSPGYLTKLWITHTLSQSVYSSINALRLAGINPEALTPNSFELPDKGAEVIRILQEYLSQLAKHGLLDYAGAIDMAVEAVAETPSPIGTDLMLLVPEDLDLTAKEKSLLSTLPTEQFFQLPVDQPSVLPASTLASPTATDLLRWILQPADAPESPVETDTVFIFRAMGEVNEVREVFRKCLDRHLCLDEVEILHTDTEIYVPLILETSIRLMPEFSGMTDLFVTFEEGIPATYSRPGKALSAWVSWVRRDFPQSDLMKMLEEGLLRIPTSNGGECDSGDLVRELKLAPILFGRDRYLKLLDETIQALGLQSDSERPQLEDDEPNRARARGASKGRVNAAKCLQELVESLLTTTPLPDADPLDLLTCARAFLEKIASTSNELDNYALNGLLKEIDDFAIYLDSESDTISLDVWEWLAALPKEVRLLGSGPRPGCVHVTNIYRGGHSGRCHTFILGLDDGRFPGAGLQDPVMLDSEREKLSRELPTAAGQLAARVQDFARLLARLRGTVTLSYPSWNLADDREIFPSQVILSAYRLISGDRDADFTRLMERLPTPASFAPAGVGVSLDGMDWWLGRLCKHNGLADPDAIIGTHFLHLSRGREATLLRNTSHFTVYDGRVVNPGPELDPTSPTSRVMSAGSLESLGKCPLLYFFRYVLDLKAPEELMLDPERWLSPADFGTLLHEVLYDFVFSAAPENWPPEFPEDVERIQEIVETRTSHYRQLIPPPTEEAFVRQLSRLQDAAQVFVRAEANSSNRKPVYSETAIGMPSFLGGTELDGLEPVSIGLQHGKTIRLRGRIDRIDRIRSSFEAEYSICDYKSGSAGRFEHHDPFNQGRVLQHALYLIMGETMLKKKIASGATVTEFSYFFPGIRDQGLRLLYRTADLSESTQIIESLCEIAATGSFLATDNSEMDCAFCDYLGICGDVQSLARRSRKKMDNHDNALLRSMRELRARE